jgi:hypothetical protein
MADAIDRLADLGDAARHPGRGLVVDEHHRLDGAGGVLREAGLDRAGSAPRRQSPGRRSTSSPHLAAICRHKVAKCPVSTISTRSPGESVLTIAASQAPVPDEGIDHDRARGLEDPLQPLQDLATRARRTRARGDR